jgi:diacylglycerol kinase family enzyme
MNETKAGVLPRRRFLIVRNKTAGVSRQDLVVRVAAALVRDGCVVTIRNTASADDLQRVAIEAQQDADAVVAAGGDGTIRALAIALEGSGVPVGIIPVGTGNVMAREIGMARRTEEIAKVLRFGRAIDIEGARANGEPFFLMAGIGFDGAIVRALNTTVKQRAGLAAYTMPVLRALLSNPHRLRVSIDDGLPQPASWVIATRATRYGGSFVLSPKAGLTKPGLVAIVVQSSGRMALLRQLVALGLGRLDRTAGVQAHICARIAVEAVKPAPTQIDGDAFAQTPIVVEAGGPRMSLIVPDHYQAAT